ncbi:MAG: hypothetical protein ACI8P3_003848, partial [Saprospiraceae bacterium]
QRKSMTTIAIHMPMPVGRLSPTSRLKPDVG